MIYCPYTDREISESQSNSEHIIPLSLGGALDLKLPVDAAFNSKLGSEIDGALANEFHTALRRTQYGARGQSGKEPVATIKRARDGRDSRLVQAHFHKKRGVHVWDVRDRKLRRPMGSIQIQASLNVDLPVRFTAKVALAAGYLVYGDLFRKHVDHGQLRDVMRIDPSELDLNRPPAENGLDHLTLRVDNWLYELPEDPDSAVLFLRTFCSAVQGSVIVLMPGHGCFGVGVGILGQYQAMVNVPARTSSFPNEGDFAWGHVLMVSGGRLERFSWMDGLKQLIDAKN